MSFPPLSPAREVFVTLREFLVSLRLTVVLLVLGIILVFAATLDQTNLGIWGIQQKWFRSVVVMQDFGRVILPIFPGGYVIGGLLLLNLIGAHLCRFRMSWRKSGIFLTHFGFILLLLGELLSGLWQEDFSLRLSVGETKNYAESFRFNELAIVDATDPKIDDVVAIPESSLEKHQTIQHPKLPFRATTKAYYPNSFLQMRANDASGSLATVGVGTRVSAAPQPVTYRQNEVNVPAAFVELSGAEGTIGTFLVSTALSESQEFQYEGRTWRIALRPRRVYRPYELTLLQFNHDRYLGTEIPRNFSSRLRLTAPNRGETREVLISMNNPLRYEGLTYYQAGFENNDRTTVLQVVRNPSWQVPYIACSLMGLGLVIQFGLHLFGFVTRSRGPHPALA